MTAVQTMDAEARGALTELLNLGAQRAAEILSELTGASVAVRVSAVRIARADPTGAVILSAPAAPETTIRQTFTGSMRGSASLSFATSAGIALARLLAGRAPAGPAELDSELTGVLLETGNIVLGGVLGALSHALPTDLRHSLPELRTTNGRGPWSTPESMHDNGGLLCDVRFRTAEQEFDGTIALAVTVRDIQGLLNSLVEPLLAR